MAGNYEYEACPRCNVFCFIENHTCAPEWDYLVDDETEWSIGGIFARDAEDAAERAGRKYDSDGDYTLSRGGEVKVFVRRVDGGDVTAWIVSAELEPVYSAREEEIE